MNEGRRRPVVSLLAVALVLQIGAVLTGWAEPPAWGPPDWLVGVWGDENGTFRVVWDQESFVLTVFNADDSSATISVTTREDGRTAALLEDHAIGPVSWENWGAVYYLHLFPPNHSEVLSIGVRRTEDATVLLLLRSGRRGVATNHAAYLHRDQ